MKNWRKILIEISYERIISFFDISQNIHYKLRVFRRKKMNPLRVVCGKIVFINHFVSSTPRVCMLCELYAKDEKADCLIIWYNI